MNLKEASIYCRLELKDYNLSGVSIIWKDMNRFLGLADPMNNHIILSNLCLKSSALLREVVKHEIAHMLDFRERGTFIRNGRNDFHGKNWKKWCKVVGVKSRLVIPI